MRNITYLFVLFALLILGCGEPKEKTAVDLILTNARVYTVDDQNTVHDAVIISDGVIVATGKWEELSTQYTSDNTVDLQRASVYPGLIDAHAHFYSYGKDQSILDLKDVGSFDDMIEKVKAYGIANPEGWIIGRGWNDEQWVAKTRVNNLKLSLLFPNRPVVLRRVDGHAALVNQAALELAGINYDTKIDGGLIDRFNGRLTGVLTDAAAEKVLELQPKLTRNQQIKALQIAEKHCLAEGLTTVADAGLGLDVIKLIDSLQKEGELKIRIYAMANPGEKEFDFFTKNGAIETNRLKMRSFKLYADGALGSHGALLLEPYCDDTANYGLLQHPIEYYDSMCGKIFRLNMQANTHCIGDSANRMILKLYSKYNRGNEDRRWRIEHAQVVDPKDWKIFGEYGIIPSVQPTHLISDMEMAHKRLCTEERLRGAYAYKSLMNSGGVIAFGTDFPVEAISPVATYLAAVYRKAPLGQTLHPEECFTPEEAIRAMTEMAAFACFWEKEIGTIEKGKKADLTILKRDLKSLKPGMRSTVVATIIEGEIVYR